MAGKKKKGAGPKPTSPGAPKGAVPSATSLERLDLVPVTNESAEQLTAAQLLSSSLLEQSNAAVPSPKVRRKKVDNGDDEGDMRQQTLSEENELLEEAEHQHAASKPRVGDLGKSEGDDNVLLASSIGEAIASDAKPSGIETVSGESDAKGNDHSNGNLARGEVPETEKVKASESGVANTNDQVVKGGGDQNRTYINAETVASVSLEEPMNTPSYVRLDPNGCADGNSSAGNSQAAGVLEEAKPIDARAGVSGDVSEGGGEVSERGGDVSKRDAGMQKGVGEGDKPAEVGMSDTVPLLSSVSDVGTGEAMEPLESTTRVSQSAAPALEGYSESVLEQAAEGPQGSAVGVTEQTGGLVSEPINTDQAASSLVQPENQTGKNLGNQRTNISLPTALPMQTPPVNPQPAAETQIISPPKPPIPETSPTLVSPPPLGATNPPLAAPQFFSPPRTASLAVASADDDTAFFEHLLEDSDEDEVTSSLTSAKGPGAPRQQLAGAPAVLSASSGLGAMQSSANPPTVPIGPPPFVRPQVQVSEQPSLVPAAPVPFGPVSPPEPGQYAQHGEGEEHRLSQAGAHPVVSAVGAFGLGIPLVESSTAGVVLGDQSSTGVGAANPFLQVALSPSTHTSPGQTASNWNFPTPRGEDDVDFFAASTPAGGQEQQAVSPPSLPNFPTADWHQPSAQPGGHLPGTWPLQPPPPPSVATHPFPQDDDVSFFNQDTPKGPQEATSQEPAPVSNDSFPNAPPHGFAPPNAATGPLASGWAVPFPGSDDGASFFEQAAATPPAAWTPYSQHHAPNHLESLHAPPFAPPSHTPGTVLSPQGEAWATSGEPGPLKVSGQMPGASDASPSLLDASLEKSDTQNSVSDALPGGLGVFPGVSDSLLGVSAGFGTSSSEVPTGVRGQVSDTAAVVATATVAAVATAVPSWNFETAGDDGDVSFFESIGGQGAEDDGFGAQSGQGGAASAEAPAVAGVLPVEPHPAYAGEQSHYPTSQSYDTSQYWSNQYNESYDWSQYQQPEAAYAQPPQSSNPEQGAYLHPQEAAYPHAGPSGTLGQGAYAQPSEGAYSQASFAPPATTAYDPSASSQYGQYYDPSASWYGAQGGPSWQPQVSDSWQAQGGDTWQQQQPTGQGWGGQHIDPESFFDQIGGGAEQATAPVPEEGPKGSDSFSLGENGPVSGIESGAMDKAWGESGAETLHDLGEGAVPTQESSQESLFSPPLESHPETPLPSNPFSPGQPEYPPLQSQLPAPPTNPAQALFPSQQPLEATGPPSFDQQPPPSNAPLPSGPPLNEFTPSPPRPMHSALPPRPPNHSRSASGTSQTGSEDQWAAASFSQEPFPAFVPRPPFVPQPFVPVGVNFFQPPKQSGPAFIPAQQELGGAGFGGLAGPWAQHTAVPRSREEAMQTSVGRPPCSVAAFGFGGKLVVLRPRDGVQIGSDMSPVGPSFGAAQSSLQIHSLSQVVALNAADGGKGVGSLYFDALGKRAYAGPLAGGHTVAKELAKWLDERMARCREEETDHQGNPESLRLLYGMLKVASQHYGKLRAAAAQSGSQEKAASGPEAALAALLSAPDQSAVAPSWGVTKTRASDPLQHQPSEQDLKRVASEMQSLLVAGKRKEALACAKQGQLWGPALALSRQLGDKVFCETVGEMAQRQFSLGSPLRTLHLLLAQQPAEVFAAKKMPAQGDSPMAGGPQPATAGDQGDGLGSMLDQWQDNLAILAANRAAGDDKVITHLGDSLWRTRGEVAAAHMCYLVADLAPEAFSGTSRVCLLGADQYKCPRTYATPEAIQRTELYEHAKMLGNPQFVLPSFQPYKLLYAAMLAEAGKTTEALRYCQLVLKTLRAGGRSPDVEAIRQGATVLEDRLQNYVRSGAATSSAKIFSGLFKAVDWGIKGIMGGIPAGGSRPTSPATKEEGTVAPPVSSWGGGAVSGNGFGSSGNGLAGTTSGAFLVGHQWAAQVQDPAQQWGENLAAFAPPQNEKAQAWDQGAGGYGPLESRQPPQQQWSGAAMSNAWQGGALQGGQNAFSGQEQSSWSVTPASEQGGQVEDAEGGGSALSSRPPTPGQSQSWNPSPAVSSGSRPSSPAGQTQSQQWGGQAGADSFLGGQWAPQSAPLISAYEGQAVASTAEGGVSKPPNPRKEEKRDGKGGADDENRKSPLRSASEPDFAKSGKSKDSGPKSVGGGSSPVRKTFAGGFLRAGSGIWGGLKNSLSSVVPVGGGGGNQAKLGDKNKFYYDEKKKKWVLEGEPEPEEEAPLPPPPTVFGPGGSKPSSVEGAKDPPTGSQALPGGAMQPPLSQGATALPAGGGAAPPPQVPNFSARGRTGVRSRYVDTFNKGGAAAAAPAKALSLPAARPPAPAPMKFFIPPPAPLGTIPDSESEAEPPDQPTASANPSEAPPGQLRDPPGTNGAQAPESSKPPLPHGHRRSHSSETSGHPPLPPGGGSHHLGGLGVLPKSHARSASQPTPPTFMIPGPPVAGNGAQAESGQGLSEAGRERSESGVAADAGGYSFALGGGSESTSQGWGGGGGYGGGVESTQQWTPPKDALNQADASLSNSRMPPPPNLGSVGALQTGTGVWGAAGMKTPDVLTGTPGGGEDGLFDTLSAASVAVGPVSSERHAKGSEVDEMTDVEL